MKAKLFFLSFLFALPLFAQNPINNYMGGIYNGPIGDGVYDGINFRSYEMVTAAEPLDQIATGPDITWNFSDLTVESSLSYSVSEPSPAELATYPNTTRVTTLIANGGVAGQVFASDNGTTFTGVWGEGLTLNYSTDNAVLGPPPYNFGYTNTDAVAGTYIYDTYTGTFTGTITTSVDAYGTLQTYAIPTPVEVTRLKTVQNLTMQYVPFGNVGTVTQTSYYYYIANPDFLWPVFKSTTTAISVPLLSINETVEVLEQQVMAFLNLPVSGQNPRITLTPNPVEAIVTLNTTEDTLIKALKITDALGKMVYSALNPESSINLDFLKPGIYFAQIETDSETRTQKLVKK